MLACLQPFQYSVLHGPCQLRCFKLIKEFLVFLQMQMNRKGVKSSTQNRQGGPLAAFNEAQFYLPGFLKKTLCRALCSLIPEQPANLSLSLDMLCADYL